MSTSMLCRKIADDHTGPRFSGIPQVRVIAASAAKRRKSRSGAAHHVGGGVEVEALRADAAATRHDLPFVVLRAIADPSDRSLPPAATIAMKQGGGIDLAAVLRSIAKTPGQLPALLAIARDTRAALSGLRRGRRLLGRGLGYLDLDQLGLDVI